MTSLDHVAAKQAVLAHIGGSAKVEEYDRSASGSNINLVLDHASRQVDGEIVLYWISDGVPEIFSVKCGSVIAIGFSDRYVQLTSLLRRLMLDPTLDRTIRSELATRTLLKFMAEFALQQKQDELAAHTFMKAMVGQTFFLADGGMLALEHHTRNEIYMTMWFYGILHELGHMVRFSDSAFLTGPLSDQEVCQAVIRILDQLPHFANHKPDILHAASTDPDHLLNFSLLRSEALADAFACSMLLETSIEILQRAGVKFSIDAFLMEQWMMLKIITVLDMCRSLVLAAVLPTSEVQWRRLLHPVAMAVRGMIVEGHLRLLILPFLRGWREKTRLRRADKLLQGITNMLQRDTDIIEEGTEQASRFVLSYGDSKPALQEAFLAEAPGSLMHQLDSRSFLRLADSFGARSASFDAIRAAAAG